ncbi:MAG: UDP-glucose 4-epimerase [Ulvibacter sp.]|jgi:UDP-glucose 4-epimerase
MKILVLGGSGFIGSHIVEKLIGQRHSVVVYGRSKNKFKAETDNVKYILGDVSNKKLLANTMNGIDMVIHLSWSSVPVGSNGRIQQDLQENVSNFIYFLDLMVIKNIRKLIFFSTGGAIYGNTCAGTISENFMKKPISSYGITKLMAERYLHLYEHLHGLQTIILRPSNPYGPLQNYHKNQGVIAKFLHLISEDKPITVYGDGSVVRDFIYIDDLVEFCMKVIRHFHPGTYHVSSNQGVSIQQIIDVIQYDAQLNVKIRYKEQRMSDVNRVVLDNSRAQKIFNWRPKVDLLKGIQRTNNWVLNSKIAVQKEQVGY